MTISSIVGWGISFAIVSWLVEGDFWLRFFLASAMSGSSRYIWDIREIKEDLKNTQYQLSVADNELVRVSALANDHEETIDELQSKINELEDKIDELTSGRNY